MANPTVTFEKSESNEWYVEIDGETVGELSRSKPARWACGNRRGLAVDRTAPWRWYFVASMGSGITCLDNIPAKSLRDAKAQIVAHLAA